MPFTVPSTIFPTQERFVNVQRELIPGTVPVTGSAQSFPVANFDPEDKPIWLPDTSLRGAMGDIYDMGQGPVLAETSIPASPVYMDLIGHPLCNVLGDYTQSAPTGTGSTTLTAVGAAGATTLTVVSVTGFTANQWIQVFQTGSTGSAEIVQVLSATGTTITLATTTPLRFNHTNGATVQGVSVAAGTYQHSFSVLNSSFVGANIYTNFGQPPTHTYTDRTQVPATGLARQYAFGRHSDVTLTGNAEKFLMWNGNLTSYVGQIAASPPTAAFSVVKAVPAWNTTVSLATSGSLAPIYNIGEWSVSFARQVEAFFPNDGSQNPYTLGVGKLAVNGKLTISPAIDENHLLYMLNNTQPQLQILVTNGRTTTDPLYLAMQVDIPFADYDTSKINSSKSLFGYDVAFKTTHTALTRNSVTSTGWSGGYSAAKVTIWNALPLF